jgi:hypothetical protein
MLIHVLSSHNPPYLSLSLSLSFSLCVCTVQRAIELKSSRILRSDPPATVQRIQVLLKALHPSIPTVDDPLALVAPADTSAILASLAHALGLESAALLPYNIVQDLQWLSCLVSVIGAENIVVVIQWMHCAAGATKRMQDETCLSGVACQAFAAGLKDELERSGYAVSATSTSGKQRASQDKQSLPQTPPGKNTGWNIRRCPQ